jgi:hypothetical protein
VTTQLQLINIIIIIIIIIIVSLGPVAQSVLRFATDWTVRGSNPGGGGKIFRTLPHRPWGPSSLLYNGYRVLPGGKAVRTWR